SPDAFRTSSTARLSGSFLTLSRLMVHPYSSSQEGAQALRSIPTLIQPTIYFPVEQASYQDFEIRRRIDYWSSHSES
ncbi:hypothetical protein Ciccas_010985, partial [Cichlidogyrus casuarinus]